MRNNLQKIKVLLLILMSVNAYLFSESHILFCWTKPDHPIGTHIYPLFAERMSEKFNELKGVRASSVSGFPSKKQWEESDLVVFYLTLNSLSKPELNIMKDHLKAGKGIVFLHQALVNRANSKELSQISGLAFSWNKADRSSWGKFTADIHLDESHPIFKGMSKVLKIDDELYWDLIKGSLGELNVIATTKPSTLRKEENTQTHPVFWTVDHENNGKVFSSVIGHFARLYDSKEFMKIFLRGMAWSMNKSVDEFEPLLNNLSFKRK